MDSQFENHFRQSEWKPGETPHQHSLFHQGDPSKHKRRHKAQTGGDKFLAQASKAFSPLAKWLREDEKAKAWAVIHALILSAVGMSLFTAIMMMWFFVFRWHFWWSVGILVGCLAVCTGLVIHGRKRRAERIWLIATGYIGIVVTFVSLCFGFFMYYHYLVYYIHYTEMRSYSNVGASQSVTQFSDGGMFLFTQDSRLDMMRSVGYKSRWTGKVYCVAPVVDSTMTSANPINFWAVGEGCCTARGEFACNDAQDTTALSALVVLEPEDIVRPFMQWATAGNVYPRYERSIHLQEAAFATRAAQQTRLVYWVKDPIAMQNTFFDEAKWATIWFGIILWTVLLVGGYFLCRYYRYTKPRADKRFADGQQQDETSALMRSSR